MIILLAKMALYIIVSVVFGYIMGVLYSNAKNREIYAHKEQKRLKIISEKNATIIKLKNELRIAHRKVNAVNQGYDLQYKLLEKKEQELARLLEATEDYNQIKKDFNSLKVEHRTLSIDLSEKIKTIDDKDEVITLLEGKIKQVTNEQA